MGSPLGPVLANIFMCSFEEKWVADVDSRPSIWFRYVNDTFALFDDVASAIGICSISTPDIQISISQLNLRKTTRSHF